MEVMLFLKFNKEFWDDKTVADAHNIKYDDDLFSRIQHLILEDYFFIIVKTFITKLIRYFLFLKCDFFDRLLKWAWIVNL